MQVLLRRIPPCLLDGLQALLGSAGLLPPAAQQDADMQPSLALVEVLLVASFRKLPPPCTRAAVCILGAAAEKKNVQIAP